MAVDRASMLRGKITWRVNFSIGPVWFTWLSEVVARGHAQHLGRMRAVEDAGSRRGDVFPR